MNSLNRFAAIPLAFMAASAAPAMERHVDTLTDHRDSWTTPDKVEHLSAGFLISATAYLLIDELAPNMKPIPKALSAFAVGVLVGALKEVSDYQQPNRHDASLKDFACTAGGAALGSVAICWVIHF